jgi:hypothetical protein
MAELVSLHVYVGKPFSMNEEAGKVQFQDKTKNTPEGAFRYH